MLTLNSHKDYSIELTKRKMVDVVVVKDELQTKKVQVTRSSLVIEDLKKTTGLEASKSIDVIKLCGGDTSRLY